MNCYNQRSYCLAACPICEDGEGRLLEPYLQSVGIEIVNEGAVDPKVFNGLLYEDYQMAFGYRYCVPGRNKWWESVGKGRDKWWRESKRKSRPLQRERLFFILWE